ncbi:MAG: O-antigen ligase domain-containing protein, partial [Dysgonamonadaceae bacterium]|nr:O-antigen ligase domain-containing protein [Dysgonamonadaceae bacterium]
MYDEKKKRMEMLIQKIKQVYFFYLFLFTLVFGVILYDVTGFKRMDEVAGILLLVLYILVSCIERKRIAVAIPVILSISLFYLCYSFYLAYNSRSAATLDFLVQIKPYLAFFMVMQMAPSFSASQKKLLKRICLYIWPFFIPIGIYGLVNPSFFKTVMDQEANYVSGIVCLSLVYLYCS